MALNHHTHGGAQVGRPLQEPAKEGLRGMHALLLREVHGDPQAIPTTVALAATVDIQEALL
eukprot:2193320-Alexandrium_andersonii.AAC.1